MCSSIFVPCASCQTNAATMKMSKNEKRKSKLETQFHTSNTCYNCLDFLLQSYASKYNKSVEEACKAGIFYLHPDGSMYSLQRGCVASLRICRPFPQQDSQSCVILFCW